MRHLHGFGTDAPPVHESPRPIAPGRSPATARLGSVVILRKEEGSTERLRRDANGVAPDADVAVARAASSSGAALPSDVRARFESSLDADLSAVRVHTGAESAAAASAVGAKAYTVGNDIHFAEGNYAPADPFGIHLLAHEVAHTQQQASSAPHRQHKLEVSAPGDPAEVEADRAADAMVAGASTSVASRPSAIAREPDSSNTGLQPLLNGGPGNAALAQGGVQEDIPVGDFAGTVQPIPVDLESSPPESTVGDPGPIPGWQVTIPPQTTNIGPFGATSSAQTMVVTGDAHSPVAKDAWAQWGAFRNRLKVTWNDDKSKLDAFIRQKKGDPTLDSVVSSMNVTGWNMNMGSTRGNVSDQGTQTNVNNGTTMNQIDGQLTDKASGAGGDQFNGDLKTTATNPQAGTVGTEVQQAVGAVNAARMQVQGAMTQAAGATQSSLGLQDQVRGAAAGLKVRQLDQAEKDKQQEIDDIKDGQAFVNSIGPRAGQIYEQVRGLDQQVQLVKQLVSVAQNATGAAAAGAKDDLAGAAMKAADAAKGAFEIAYWVDIQTKNEELATLAQQHHDALEEQALATFLGVTRNAAGAAKVVAGLAQSIQGLLLTEKQAFEHLATVLESSDKSGSPNWKGQNQADGKLAAQAMRALPVARRLLDFMNQVQSELAPDMPDPGTRANQGYTLATEGVGAPGPAGALDTGGRIRGARGPVGNEINRWTAIVARMEQVAHQLGVVGM